MADLRQTLLAPGMESLCLDAQRLAATFPAPITEKSGSWRPAPYDLAPASSWLRDGMPRVLR